MSQDDVVQAILNAQEPEQPKTDTTAKIRDNVCQFPTDSKKSFNQDRTLKYNNFDNIFFESERRNQFKQYVLNTLPSRSKFNGTPIQIAEQVRLDLFSKYGEKQVVFDGADYWYFDGKLWKTIIDTKAYSEIELWINQYDGLSYCVKQNPKTEEPTCHEIKLSAQSVNLIKKTLQNTLHIPGFFKDNHTIGINCHNGFLQFDREGKANLISHTAELKQRHIIEAEWDESWNLDDLDLPDDSLLLRYFQGCFGDSADDELQNIISLIGEVLGAICGSYGTKVKAPKAFILLGETANNGKSQFLHMINSFIHEDYVSCVPLENLGNTYDRYHLKDKSLNFTNEIGSSEAIASDMFKSVVTGEKLMARDLYKSNVEFYPTALNVSAANNMPSFKGGIDQGVCRRLYIIHFNRSIPKDEVIPNIAQRIIDEEMYLLLRLAAIGLANLICNKDYTCVPRFQNYLEDWTTHADSFLAWFDECVTPTNLDHNRVSSREAYNHYKIWATTLAHYMPNQIIGINRFTERMKGMKNRGVFYKHANGFRGFIQLTLAPLPSPDFF